MAIEHLLRNKESRGIVFPQSYGYSTSFDIIEAGKTVLDVFTQISMAIEHLLRNKESRGIVFFSNLMVIQHLLTSLKLGKTVLDVFTQILWPLNIF